VEGTVNCNWFRPVKAVTKTANWNAGMRV
jgi:hypothetical protein